MKAQLNATNLIASSEIDQWQAIDRSKSKGSWTKSEDGAIAQTKRSGTKAAASGTMLLFKSEEGQKIPQLHVIANPGSKYQTGIVFNYRDRKNFYIFTVNQFSDDYKGYWINVGIVENDDYITLCKEKYLQELDDETSFTVSATSSGLELFLDGHPIFIIEDDQFDASSQFGLYSQQNAEAVFKAVYTEKTTDQAEVDNTEAPKEPASIEDVDQEMVQEIKEEQTANLSNSALFTAPGPEPFLNLKEPKARSLIEFNKVFKVAFDSFYSSLYFNSGFDSKPQPLRKTYLSQTYWTDGRVNGWYREYNQLKKLLELARNDINRSKANLDTLEGLDTNTEGFDAIQYRKDISTARDIYFQNIDKFELLSNEKNHLVNEITSNGYTIRENDTQVPAAIKDQGYDFYLAGGIAYKRAFIPLEVPTAFDWKDDVAWAAFEKKLKTKLHKDHRFPAASKVKYTTQAETMDTQESYRPIIQPDIDKASQDIESSTQLLGQLNTRLAAIPKNIADWKADRALLLSEMNRFKDYNPGEYHTNGGGNGPANHHHFKAWLGSSANRFKIFTYSSSSSSKTDYQVNLNSAGKQWSHRYIRKTIHRSRQEPYTVRHAIKIWPGITIGYRHQTKYRTVTWVEYSYSFAGTDPNVKNFFRNAVAICDAHINNLLPSESNSLEEKITKEKNAKMGSEVYKADLEENGLMRARKSFVTSWNTNEVLTSIGDEDDDAVYPGTNQLEEIITSLKDSSDDTFKVIHVNLESDGFYTHEGQPLLNFVESLDQQSERIVLTCPHFDKEGRGIPDVRKVVVDPKPASGNEAELPEIDFVETYHTEIAWSGFCLGEMSHSVNLAPGETKELIVEKATKVTRKKSETRKEDDKKVAKEATSLEDKLNNELSDKSLNSIKENTSNEQSRKESRKSLFTNESESTHKVDVKAEAGWGWGSVEASYGYSGTSKSKSEKQNAMDLSQNAKKQMANSNEKEQLKKQISNLINKSSSEVSSENAVSFSSVSSEDFESSTSEKEVINLENPNMGRSINYYFFQLQNIYNTQTRLVDVKVVVDPGVELLEKTGLTNRKVYDLEEFGKIHANSTLGRKHPRNQLFSAFVAKHVIKNYLAKGPNSEKPLEVVGASPISAEIVQVLNFNNAWTSKSSLNDDLINSLQTSLDYLKGVNFRFDQVVFIPEFTETINTGSYYMDSEVGKNPATESYLEERRDIETSHKRAEVEHLQAQTKAEKFFPPVGKGTLAPATNGQAEPAVEA